MEFGFSYRASKERTVPSFRALIYSIHANFTWKNMTVENTWEFGESESKIFSLLHDFFEKISLILDYFIGSFCMDVL